MTGDVNDVMPGSAEDFGIWKKKQLVEIRRCTKQVEFRSKPRRPVVCGGGPARGGLRWKSQDRKKLCLSLLMSKNLKLKKGNKKFRTWTNFGVFGFLYVYEHY